MMKGRRQGEEGSYSEPDVGVVGIVGYLLPYFRYNETSDCNYFISWYKQWLLIDSLTNSIIAVLQLNCDAYTATLNNYDQNLYTQTEQKGNTTNTRLSQNTSICICMSLCLNSLLMKVLFYVGKTMQPCVFCRLLSFFRIMINYSAKTK